MFNEKTDPIKAAEELRARLTEADTQICPLIGMACIDDCCTFFDIEPAPDYRECCIQAIASAAALLVADRVNAPRQIAARGGDPLEREGLPLDSPFFGPAGGALGDYLHKRAPVNRPPTVGA